MKKINVQANQSKRILILKDILCIFVLHHRTYSPFLALRIDYSI
jgi:hypothetical protein